MATVTIMDPVTRIEGHMKVEVSIDTVGGQQQIVDAEVSIDTVGGQQQIVDARCTGTLFRGFEKLLEGRNPHDAAVITPRICGVCPVSHGLASVMTLEDAAGFMVPENARVLRNLVLGSNFVMSHILHFYLLAALDFVPGPQAQPWQSAWQVDLRSGTGLGQVSQNIAAAVEARRRAHEMGAIFGGRMPSAHAYIPGGFTAVPNQQDIDTFRAHLNWLVNFINNSYLPDVQAVAAAYGDYFNIGAGSENLLAFGVFDLDDMGQQKLLGRGQYEKAMGQVQAVDLQAISESVTYSWYQDSGNDLHPSQGVQEAVYPKAEAYSWLKAPRLANKPYETGALARMWVNGDYRDSISVMGRHQARAQETLKIAEAMNGWLNELNLGQPVYSDYACPTSGTGIGLTEAPRGALGHWMRVNNSKLEKYQIITPTCWNASPKDSLGANGPMEQALIGTPVMDPSKPVEALRVIHSFDPCLSCAVHVMQPDGKATIVKAGSV